jgi:hypothetical protein
MAIKIELFEDRGAPIAPTYARGTTYPTWELDVGTNSDVTDFQSRGTLVRPSDPGVYTYTYQRYIFAKISCTTPSDYKTISSAFWYIENTITTSSYASLLYKTTNIYQQPTNSAMSGATILSVGQPNIVVNLNNSLTGPDAATTFTALQDGVTFYTNYIVLQIRGEYPSTTPSSMPEITCNLILNEGPNS